ncbi:hypothetical protein EGR_08723 [Echinococcus granulosus]|uniref:Uncharacterized protein n=1 Tax=Echinococcus granulosus TaxID=6210 RepID=W6USJ1_ECHGR|nr:hypothetical protein EGR_08723 [Echinococcus granulosus]EUB56409.1 hypothetical protein EGR_08723 [Echinococcus granulosus]
MGDFLGLNVYFPSTPIIRLVECHKFQFSVQNTIALQQRLSDALPYVCSAIISASVKETHYFLIKSLRRFCDDYLSFEGSDQGVSNLFSKMISSTLYISPLCSTPLCSFFQKNCLLIPTLFASPSLKQWKQFASFVRRQLLFKLKICIVDLAEWQLTQRNESHKRSQCMPMSDTLHYAIEKKKENTN